MGSLESAVMRFSKSIEELSGHAQNDLINVVDANFARFDDNSSRILLVLRYKADNSYVTGPGKLIYRVPLVG